MTNWRNWGRTESASIERLRPGSAEEVSAVIREAREKGQGVKPIGTSHSFSGVGVPRDIQLDMTGFSGITKVDGNAVTVGAGSKLHALSHELGARGLAFQNLGDIDVQSISGAISTGTHGTGSEFGGLATTVTGVTLVTGTGEILTINAAENAELLPAVALSLGALGVITDVTFDAVPSFGLAIDEKAEPLDQVLEEWKPRVDDADHFEFYWFPHTTSVKTMTSKRLAPDVPMQPLSGFSHWWEDSFMSNTAYGVSVNLQRMMPKRTPAINRWSVGAWGNRQFSDLSYKVFATERRVHFREMEYALPREEIPAVLREIDALIEKNGWCISFPVEVRAAAKDDLWMSTATGRDTGYIAVHRFYREDPTEYFAGVEDIFRAHGGRPHWGKMNTRTAEDLAPVYPHFGDFLTVRDRLDPDRVFANSYLERVLGK